MGDRRFAVCGRSGNATGGRLRTCALLVALLIGSGRVHAQTPPQPGPQTAQSQLQLFQAGMKDYARSLANSPRLKKLSDQQRESLVEFVAGNMLFVLLHELGHAAMQEMGMPILGRAEDQADNYAIIRLISLGDQVSHRVLVEAAKGWFLSDRRDRKDGESLAYYDEHGFDKQRAYNIACLVFGSDPDHMADLAKETKLPPERQDTCVAQDFPRISSSWDAVLKAHQRPADQPKTKIEVIYGDGKGDLDVFAQGFRRIRMLEMVVDVTSNNLAWPKPFVVEWQACGVINAHWVVDTRRLTLCYELAQDFAQLYRDFNVEPQPIAKSKRKSK